MQIKIGWAIAYLHAVYSFLLLREHWGLQNRAVKPQDILSNTENLTCDQAKFSRSLHSLTGFFARPQKDRE